MSKPIYVTRPDLPPLDDLIPMLEEIWASRVLTNNGPFHSRFESTLCAWLGVNNLSLVCNGSLALSLALEAADLGGEVITTPYSFVATAHCVKLGQLEPVFIDIRPDDFNIDASLIEAAITPRTKAIVGVHVYGNPCATDEIARIADKHNLTVIYDAAHAFGVMYKNRSLVGEGDFSTLSFHATKAFNTFEGGAIVARSPEAKRQIDRRRNFGILDEVTVASVGTNAKMSEFNAALGLLQLARFEKVRAERGDVDRRYREVLEGVPGIKCLAYPRDVVPNYSYFPVLVESDFRCTRDVLYHDLRAKGVFARRYFYPLLSTMPMYREARSADRRNLPVAHRVAEQVLCLPIYPDLSAEDQDRIIDLIRG